MEWYAKYMFRIGENYNIPVIDLSRTMNPFDKSHYGQSPTQPSNKAGQFIVDLIVHSIANFNFESADRFAMVFYGTENIQCLKCDKNARSGYLRELQKIMPSEQMGMNELDLLGDLFAEDDAKETENKNTNDKPVETTKRKWSLLKQKNKGGNNNGNASTNGSNGNTPDVDGSKNDDDKTMDQILFETELDPNMKFFSTYDSKPQTGTDYSDLPAQTRSRNKHSLFDTQNDTLLKSYTNNDKKTDDNETNNTTNTTNNTTNTTTTTTNNNTNTIPTINENTNESKERKEKENENENGNETESKIEDTSNITRHRAQAAQAQDQDHPSTSLMSSTTTASENSENVEHVQNRSSRRIAVADMSAAMESMNSNSNTVTNTIITTSSSSNTNDDTATNTNTSSPDFPRISRPRIGYDASA